MQDEGRVISLSDALARCLETPSLGTVLFCHRRGRKEESSAESCPTDSVQQLCTSPLLCLTSPSCLWVWNRHVASGHQATSANQRNKEFKAQDIFIHFLVNKIWSFNLQCLSYYIESAILGLHNLNELLGMKQK